MTGSPSARQRGRWPVVAVHGTVAATVLLLVAVLALVVKPPAPPGIAAFAPQANKPITKAPPAQSARFGNGAGQCAAGQVCVGPSATPPAGGPSAVPTVSPPTLKGAAPPGLQCYTWPDGTVTQTFDPQSPPCISRWDDTKGNGGATSQGVTGTTIDVAFPVTAAQSTWPTLQPIVDFFNTRFQLYGRKIKIVPVPSQQADGTVQGKWNDPLLQKADAAAITQRKPFATLDFIDPISETGTLPLFLDAMKRAKIVSINGGETVPLGTAKDLESHAPYAWSYYPTVDQVLRNVAAMTCRQLAGKPAGHAPDPALRTKARKFALWIPRDDQLGGPLPGLGTFLRTLDGCGIHDPAVVRNPEGRSAAAGSAAQLSALQRDGVTSVLYYPYGGNGQAGAPLTSAASINYRPEWVVMGWSNYNTAFILNDPSTESSGAFGVGSWNKQAPLSQEPWTQASVAAGGNSTVNAMPCGRAFYQEMLLLASAIQMAGPQLTPETFAEGLRTTRFPNPGAAGPPFYQGTVGFEDGDSVMVDDYTAFWLDTRKSGQQVSNSTGINQYDAFCAVEFGRRWSEDTWPRKDGFYAPGVCR
jgi:hypothetical protein